MKTPNARLHALSAVGKKVRHRFSPIFVAAVLACSFLFFYNDMIVEANSTPAAPASTPEPCGLQEECTTPGPGGGSTPRVTRTPDPCRKGECGTLGPGGGRSTPRTTRTPDPCREAECDMSEPDDTSPGIDLCDFLNCQGDGSNNSNPLPTWDPCLFIQCGSPVQPQFPLPWDGISTEFPAQFQRGIVDAQNSFYRMWQESLTRMQTNTHRNNATSQP